MHTGVMLHKFRPVLPARLGQSFLIMPPGREAEWSTYRDQIAHEEEQIFGGSQLGLAADHWWERFRDFHHGSPATWPDVLHCREFRQQAQMLSPFTTQLWRTVWFHNGIRDLDASYDLSYAITFTLQAKEKQSTVQGLDQDKDLGRTRG